MCMCLCELKSKEKNNKQEEVVENEHLKTFSLLAIVSHQRQTYVRCTNVSNEYSKFFFVTHYSQLWLSKTKKKRNNKQHRNLELHLTLQYYSHSLPCVEYNFIVCIICSNIKIKQRAIEKLEWLFTVCGVAREWLWMEWKVIWYRHQAGNLMQLDFHL